MKKTSYFDPASGKEVIFTETRSVWFTYSKSDVVSGQGVSESKDGSVHVITVYRPGSLKEGKPYVIGRGYLGYFWEAVAEQRKLSGVTSETDASMSTT